MLGVGIIYVAFYKIQKNVSNEARPTYLLPCMVQEMWDSYEACGKRMQSEVAENAECT